MTRFRKIPGLLTGSLAMLLFMAAAAAASFSASKTVEGGINWSKIMQASAQTELQSNGL